MAVKRQSTGAAPKTPPASSSVSGNFNWTPENEIILYNAILGGRKPSGVSKHFQMASIHEKLVRDGLKDITPKAIWDYLDSLYAMESVEEIEREGVEKKEREVIEFSLPKKEFAAAFAEMKKSGHINAEGQFAPTKETSKKSTTKDSSLGTKSEETSKASKRPTRSTPGSAKKKKTK